MVRRFQRLNDIPRLAFHDSNLLSVHALFEVCVLCKALPKRLLGIAPPLFGCEEREEMATGSFGEGLSNKGHGQEKPAKGITAPLRIVRWVEI